MACFNFFGGCSETDALLDDLAHVEHVADMTEVFCRNLDGKCHVHSFVTCIFTVPHMILD